MSRKRPLARNVEFLESRELLTTLPTGFAEFEITPRLDSAPVGLLRAPDGRLFISTDDNDNLGSIRVVKNDALLNTPALELSIRSSGEHGMIGWTLDPNFDANGYVYLMYTTEQGGIHHRISRFTFTGDTINPNSEFVLMDLDLLDTGSVHNGGGMAFGNDGKLYVGVGDNQVATNAESLNTVLGKILRINPDGSIPTDNPFYNQTSGNNRAIYALGVRNPFSMDADEVSGRIFFNDTGPSTYEEVNEVKYGADYGWPGQGASQGSGPNGDPAYEDPVYSYLQAANPGSCAITAGNFHRTTNPTFPAAHTDKYYFADYCGAWIRGYDLNTGNVEAFATGTSVGPVSLEVDDEGSLYYLSFQERKVFKISHLADNALQITQQPADALVAVGQTATFSVRAAPDSPDGPFTYQWQMRPSGVGSFSNILGATDRVLTISSASANDDSTQYRAIVFSGADSVTSDFATLSVTAGSPPTPVITLPSLTATYTAGDTFSFAGFATDPDENGNLPAANLTWEVTFQHDDHDHPQFGPISGISEGSIRVPTIGETSANTWFRIHLTAEDSSGLSSYTYRDIFPETSTFTIESNVPGVELLLDGTPVATPTSTQGVVGVRRTIGAASPQLVNGKQYEFVGWSDGGEISHVISTPATNQTFTATFQEVVDPSGPVPGAIAAYKFEEGTGSIANDTATSGISDPAILTNGASWSNDGVSGEAIRFDGVDDFLAVPDSVDFNAEDFTKRTISLWFKPDDVNNAAKQLIYKQQGSARGLNIYLESGQLYVGGFNDKAGWAGTFLNTGAIQSNTWHHVAVVLDADITLGPDGLRGYLDGVQFGSGDGAQIKKHLGNTSLGFNDQTTRFHTGDSNLGVDGGAPYAGLIDEVFIYDRALTTAEIETLAGGDSSCGYEGGSEVDPCSPAPSLTTTFTPTAVQGEYTLNVTLENFTLNPNAVDGPSVANEGHMHLLIDGVKVDRFFDLTRTVTVPAGQHLVEVELATNDHQSWTLNGAPIRSGATLAGPTGGGGHDHGGHNHDVVIPGVVTQFKFDEGTGAAATDSAPSGAASDLAYLTAGAAWSNDGLSNGAVQFDGIDDYLAIPDSTDFNDRRVEDTTISLWFKADDVNRGGKQLLFKQNGHPRGLNIYLDEGLLYVGGWNDRENWAGTFLATAPGELQSETWHHVSLVLEISGSNGTDGLRGYLDGQLFGSGPATEVTRHLGDATIGRIVQTTRFHDAARSSVAVDNNAPFGGLIDDFRVFHRALNEAELLTLATGDQTSSNTEEAVAPIPEVTMSLAPTATNGEFELSVSLTNFTVTPNAVDGLSVPNEGHMHLYINGEKIERFFDLQRTITIPTGQHLVEVELSTNDHKAWTVGGTPIRASQSVTVDNPNGPGDVPGAITHFSLDEATGSLTTDLTTVGFIDTANLVNGASWDADAVGGSSVRFDGVNDRLVVPDSPDFNDQTIEQATYSLWFKADDVDATGKQPLFKQNGPTRGLSVYLFGGELYVGAFNENVGWAGTFLNTGGIQSGQWHHVAFTLDGGDTVQPNRFSGYLDGVQFASGPGAKVTKHLGNISFGSLDNLTRFHTGESRGADSLSAYAGLIDEIRVYDRVLTAAEIQTLAGAVAPPPVPPKMPAMTSSMNPMHKAIDDIFAIEGDSNLDGSVDFTDFLVLADNYGRDHEEGREAGDFDGNGRTDFADFLLIARSFGA